MTMTKQSIALATRLITAILTVSFCAYWASAQTCELYPIALSIDTLKGVQPGAVIDDILNGTQPGNFGWLSWTADQSSTTLANSLTPPGDSYKYTNPDNPNDHIINVGDWVCGLSGVNNDRKVRRALDQLLTCDIIVPVWDKARGEGANTAYQVAGFAKVRLISYRLPSQNKITVKFLGLVNCEPTNHPPLALSLSVTGYVNHPIQITLSGTDPDNQPITYIITSNPEHGQITGTVPNLTYIPAANYIGTDSLTYVVSDGQATSQLALVTITILPTLQGLQVDAGPDQIINFPNQATLNGSVTFIPPPDTPLVSSVSLGWRVLEGPGSVTFSNPTNTLTVATFTQPGIYRLELTAVADNLTASDTTTVIVNAPPVVYTGPTTTNYTDEPITLVGWATDDGLPPNSGLIFKWVVVNGPGSVTVLDPDETNTIAYFPTPGEYVLRLIADDGATSSWNETSVVIMPRLVTNTCDTYLIPIKGFASLTPLSNNFHDVVFVIDTSASTRRLTGFDLNNDGKIDTIFEAEVEACRRLVQLLSNSPRIRMGVVKYARYYTSNAPPGSISDGPPLTNQTRVVQPLTRDVNLINKALDKIVNEGAIGGTHTEMGIKLAVETLNSAPPICSNCPCKPNKHIILLTDGIPTLPIETGFTQERGDRLATLEAARAAAAAGVKIHPIVIDPEDQVERRLTTMPAVQAITGVPGEIMRVNINNIDRLPVLLAGLNLVGVREVQVLELGANRLWSISVKPDGWFESYLPVFNTGTNLWEIRFLSGQKNSEQIASKKIWFVVHQTLNQHDVWNYYLQLPAVGNLSFLETPSGTPLKTNGAAPSLLDILKASTPTAKILPGVELFQVNTNAFRVTLFFKGSDKNSDVGYFIYDPASPPKSIADILPTLTQSNVLFNSGVIPTQSITNFAIPGTISVPEDKAIGFFVVPNGTLQNVLNGQTSQIVFTLSELNPGQYNHFLTFFDPNKAAVIFALEDDNSYLCNINADFQDIVFAVEPIRLPLPNKLQCRSSK